MELFSIKNSDIMRAKALLYDNKYRYYNEISKITEVDGFDRENYLLFTRTSDGRFELRLCPRITRRNCYCKRR